MLMVLCIDDEHLLPDEKLFWDYKNGPLLYRGYSRKSDVDCTEVEKILKEIGARRIIVGHTPKKVCPGVCPDY